jgi:hypothetical protein
MACIFGSSNRGGLSSRQAKGRGASALKVRRNEVRYVLLRLAKQRAAAF